MVFSIQNATTANQRALLQIKHDRNAVMQTAEIRAAQADGRTRTALSENLQEALDYQSFVSETLVQIGLAYTQMQEVLYGAAANGSSSAALPGEVVSQYAAIRAQMVELGTAKYNEGSQTFNAFAVDNAFATDTTHYLVRGAVATVWNRITINDHGLSDGDSILYEANGETPISGLQDGATYYAIRFQDWAIQLAETLDDATQGIAINLETNVGSPNGPAVTGQTLTKIITGNLKKNQIGMYNASIF